MNTIDYDDRSAGNRSWRRRDYALLNDALTRLLSPIESWNELAVRHGASRAPYEEDRIALLRMIEWGNAQLAAPHSAEIEVKGISVGSLRYIKAALILDSWRLDKEAEESPDLARAPKLVRDAVAHRVRRVRELAEEIQYPPATILDEFREGHGAMPTPTTPTQEWDAFVSHASEDKASFVDALVADLRASGLKIWYDSTELSLGDSLRRSIDRGLAHSRFGVIVLSHAFFAKEWPRRELDGLAAREIEGVKVLLPVWHNLSEQDVRKYSPMLADRLGVPTSKGLQQVVQEVVRAIGSASTA